MTRAYCLADKPFPVGERAMNTLRMIAEVPQPLSRAARQIGRLKRGGYVVVDIYNMARITEAGRALIAGTLRGAERRAEGQSSAEGAGDHDERA